MVAASVNGELSVSFPSEFSVMEISELNQAFSTSNPNMWGIRSKVNHIILVITWHEPKQAGFFKKVFSVREQAERAERIQRKIYKKGNYRLDGFFETVLGGREAHGYRYDYQNKDALQSAETIVFRQGPYSYTLYYYTRRGLATSNRKVYESILESITFE